MQFKVSFARIVSEAQLVEGVIEADSKEEAEVKLSADEYKRFLIVKRELREITPAGTPELERIS